MHSDALDLRKTYLLKHTTRTVRARIAQIRHRVDINALEKVPAAHLEMNDIAAVDVQTTLPLFFDSYRENRTTGSFILMDPISNATVAAGIIESSLDEDIAASRPDDDGVTTEERNSRWGHGAAAVWLAGRPRAARLVERVLFDEGWHIRLVETGDFDAAEIGTAAKAFQIAGIVAIFSALEPLGKQEITIQAAFGPDDFFAGHAEDDTDEALATQILERLRAWRRKQSSERGQQK